MTSLIYSDGSGPKKTSPGPSLSPSLKAGPRAGPGGLAGLILLLINPKDINLTQNSSKVNFLNFIRMLEKYRIRVIKPPLLIKPPCKYFI